MNAPLPEMPGVSRDTLENFLRAVETVGDGGIDAARHPVRIVRTAGRCIEVSTGAILPDWHGCSEWLIGAGRSCEEFRRIGAFGIVARLKSIAQSAADDEALELDEKHGELNTYWPFISDHVVGGPERIREIHAATKSRQSKAPAEGVGKRIIEHLDGEMKLGDLIALVRADMPEKLDKRGRDRREEIIRDRLKALVKSGHVVISDDGESVSLPGEDDAG